jgi:uncharacterized membrane-anchored protein YhcB (DUF1043 family)
MAQAVATVVAVLVGWALGYLSDRRTRRTLKRENERERRIEAVVGVLDGLTVASDACEQILNKLAGSLTIDPATPSGAVQQQTALHEARVSGDGARLALQGASVATIRASLLAKLLDLPSKIAGLVAEAPELVRSLSDDVTQALSGDSDALARLAPQLRQTRLLILQLIDEGKVLE